MNINDLTIGQAKELASLFGASKSENISSGLNSMIGKKVIIRTYSAGVWFGLLVQKDGNEVILENARRMYQWWCKNGISLSAVALYGLNIPKSKIIEAVPNVWLEAIEIIPCSDVSIKDLEEAPNVKAQ
ncbi:MAG TPA: hypothetical protein VFM18_22440 [Methanosarcina sp.]|nr:hypothetical protein [Methanosarcina sp.]